VALQKESIPNKVVGGHKFFERLEVKDLLAYMQLVDNPNFSVSKMAYLRSLILSSLNLTNSAGIRESGERTQTSHWRQGEASFYPSSLTRLILYKLPVRTRSTRSIASHEDLSFASCRDDRGW
jgi:superfamily I DNA/RNA helicase